MRWLVLLALLAAYPAFAQEEDDDESTIEVESEEPDDDEEEDAAEASKQKPPKTSKPKPPASRKQRPVGKDGLVLLKGTKKELSIRIPASWRVEQTELKKAPASFFLEFPDSGSRAHIRVELFSRPDEPRGLPEANRRVVAPLPDVSSVHIENRILPHLVYSRKQDGDVFIYVQAFVRHRGWTLRVVFSVPRKQFDAVYEPLLRCALTAQVARPPWPAIPSGYKVMKKHGFRWASHPAVDGPSKHMLSLTRAIRKRFEKIHGKPSPPPKGTPAPVIFLHASNYDARPLAEWIGKQPSAFMADTSTLEVFATPAPEADFQRDQQIGNTFGRFLIQRRYGTALPRWVVTGELMTTAEETTTSKRLPSITLGYRKYASGADLPTLDTLFGRQESTPEFYNQSFSYVVFFRCGPAKYKKAYRKYLRDIEVRYDAAAAAKRHLEPLDYRKLQAAAQKYLQNGLKVVIVKR